MEYKKKLIEVALPLEAINAACAYEKMPGIGPHPRGIHLWWARRPLAAARAVIWSSLVDDPSSLPEQFQTEEAQNAERQRLFGILERLVKWENSNNEEVLAEAKAEIMKSTGGNPPALLDPFAGGGAIPLEAQRLGLEAHASDLNPVAVMINKAMIEIPPKFAGQPPVNPESRRLMNNQWKGATGLAEDVRYYGEWMKKRAFERIGHLYPKVKDEHGQEHTVIAWIWARTVKCPNPACGCEMPLIHSFGLARKKGKHTSLKPIINGNTVDFKIVNEKSDSGTVNRSGAHCICCNTPVSFSYIREEGKAGRMKNRMIAIVGASSKGRIYLEPDDNSIRSANVEKPNNYPDAELAFNPRNFNTPIYGLTHFSHLFTNRQLIALTTLTELLTDVSKEIEERASELMQGIKAKEYATAIKVYLAFAIDRCADFSNAITRWVPTNEKVMNLFGKQAIAMTWDFPEANVLANTVGGFEQIINYITQCLLKLPVVSKDGIGIAKQADAQTARYERTYVISTDPPYYDNIVYADLADFFYIWLRQSLKSDFPDLFRTMLVPKVEELVAAPYRFNGDMGSAHLFFEEGMLRTFENIRDYSCTNIPVTVYYAYKQSKEDDNNATSSSGWETMLTAIVQAGFSITGTWPLRTEQGYRMIGTSANALASSIVLVCRKRPADAPVSTRRDFINTLKRELKPALQKLQASNIAPVDLAQSAIGPGMGVYSRFSKVLEADGTPMSVRSALQIINQELDLYFTEQDGELDRDSRFCVDLYTQYAFNDMKFGEADVLARAKNTSVEKLTVCGVLYAQKGVVRLLGRDEIPEKITSGDRIIWLLTQQLTRAMEKDGVVGAAEIVTDIFTSEPEHAKALAYRLFQIAERKGWAGEAYAYNSLVIAWPEIQSKAADITAQRNNAKQMTLFDIAEND